MNNSKALKKYSRSKGFFGHHDIDIQYYEPNSLIIDQIYNLACPASPIAYQKNPIQTLLTNVNGSLNLLKIAQEHNATILQASTSEVYGDPTQHPQEESYWGNVNPIGIRSCYDEGKRAAETLFFDYWRTYGTKIKVARIFNTYGPYMAKDDGRVISNFINQLLDKKPITIYGNGEQTRSFCYVDDLVDGLIRFMNSPDDVVGPINLGNPNTEYSILGIAKVLNQLINGNEIPKIVFKVLPGDDPRQRNPNIEKAKKLLGWCPKVSTLEGLEKTIEYFRTN